MKQHDAVRLILTTSLSDREIASAVGLSKTTVGRYRHIAESKRLTWEMLRSTGPTELQSTFNKQRSGGKRKPVPDLALIHQQLQQKGMTLQVIWEEYRREDPKNSLSYSHLAALLKRYRETLPTTMRQYHEPGKRLFVDYSGLRPYYFDPKTQDKVYVELFVGVLGASGLFFATCTPSQQVPDFIRAHVSMLEYFGGAPEVVVPDNLKSAVIKPGRIPGLQRTYEDFARHYGVAILPARPGHPRDKAAVEQAVKYAQQRILARMNHQKFYSIDEINASIATLLEEANGRPMVKDGKSRRERFELLERQALRPLPDTQYQYAEWVAIPTVPKDYHVPVYGHFYSVPHRLIGQRVDARVIENTVEVYHERACVARHARSSSTGAHTTATSHQPEAHRVQAGRTPEGMLAWAKSVGPSVLRLVRQQLSGPNPNVGLPACDTLRSLAHKHGTKPVEKAACDAVALDSLNITTLKRLLESAAAATQRTRAPRNSTTQGPHYYARGVSC